MKFHWINKILKDKKENDRLLYCYQIKKNLTLCLKENNGNVENCNKLNKDFNNCLNYVDKKLLKNLEEENKKNL